MIDWMKIIYRECHVTVIVRGSFTTTVSPPHQVSEIKAELELRGVSYAGVLERNELEALLLDARVKGKARPEILDQFNEAQTTAGDGGRQPDIDWESAKSGDGACVRACVSIACDNPGIIFVPYTCMTFTYTYAGSLPGGVDAEALKKLTSNQELMELMANEKLQVRCLGYLAGCFIGRVWCG